MSNRIVNARADKGSIRSGSATNLTVDYESEDDGTVQVVAPDGFTIAAAPPPALASAVGSISFPVTIHRTGQHKTCRLRVSFFNTSRDVTVEVESGRIVNAAADKASLKSGSATNLTVAYESDFDGAVQVVAPDGFTITAAPPPARASAGGSLSFPVTIQRTGTHNTCRFQVSFFQTSKDVTVEVE